MKAPGAWALERKMRDKSKFREGNTGGISENYSNMNKQSVFISYPYG